MSSHEEYGSARKVGLKSKRKNDSDITELIAKTESLNIDNETKNTSSFYTLEKILGPLILTCLSLAIRFHQIDLAKTVVWDEAHFGKFGAYYLRHEFYFDVHPPLGKLLVGFSGYLAGFNGSYDFDSGSNIPEHVNHVKMRMFNALFNVFCVPIAYYTAKELGYSLLTTYFISFMVLCELTYVALGKFILLDSMLLFFTVTTFYCLSKVHKLRSSNKELTLKWFKWLILTGISIGCVCSVKWVGFFVTVLVGVFTIYDLFLKYCQEDLPRIEYYKHWLIRIISLIVVPFIIYLICFKIHFMTLYKSGTGDGSVSSLFQVNLQNNSVIMGPRNVAYGSDVTIRSLGLSPNLLHSHNHNYPDGSHQQQITTYGHKDNNNEFSIEFDLFSQRRAEREDDVSLVKNNDVIRLIHKSTSCLLHSHAISAPLSKAHHEVSCYASIKDSDSKDDWVVEIVEQIPSADTSIIENPEILHPLSTNFRLRHRDLGCYLATTGLALPSWGFNQGEVICKYSMFQNDKNTWWNIEDHINNKLPIKKNYVPPKARFWREFVLLNYAMMASNNALLPDPDKFDRLASKWWEWPTLHVGLRMCGWGTNDVKYFLVGHPFITLGSTLSILLFVLYLLRQLYLWQRQRLLVTPYHWNYLLGCGIFPLAGWILHFAPFIMMGRVTYVHHYVPALYFSMFVFGFVIEHYTAKINNRYTKLTAFLILYYTIFAVFWYYKSLCFGMVGDRANFYHLKFLSSWMI